MDHMAKYLFSLSDYFVYRVHSQRPKLDLLPESSPGYFQGLEIAMVSYSDGKYALVTLQPVAQFTFRLHVYRSGADGESGSWTSKLVDLEVEERLRDKVCPIPPSSQRQVYHVTTKVITLGGAKGTVGWVDLSRGILLCDVLQERPKLLSVTSRCPFPLRPIGVSCLIAAHTIPVTSPSTRAKTLSSMSRWNSLGQLMGPPHLIVAING